MTYSEIRITMPPFIRRRENGNGELRTYAPKISKSGAKNLVESGFPPMRPAICRNEIGCYTTSDSERQSCCERGAKTKRISPTKFGGLVQLWV